MPLRRLLQHDKLGSKALHFYRDCIPRPSLCLCKNRGRTPHNLHCACRRPLLSYECLMNVKILHGGGRPMNAKVEDPMGLETGIRIDMVRTVLDKTKGNIIIHGRMTACTRSVVSPDVEPDVECAIIDKDGCVAIVSLSYHNGCFWINRQAMFTIRVEDVPGAISWDDISELQLRLIYHRN